MKRIIRLTESDLARIVRRVINEQNPPTKRNIIDAGFNGVTQQYAVVTSNPTVIPGSGYEGNPSAQVKFSGLIVGVGGNIVKEGNIVMYAICGSTPPKNGKPGTQFSAGVLSDESSNAVAVSANSHYAFSKGQAVSNAVTEFCKTKGKPFDPNTGKVVDWISSAKKLLS